MIFLETKISPWIIFLALFKHKIVEIVQFYTHITQGEIETYLLNMKFTLFVARHLKQILSGII